jgi:hypothetical protein
MEVIVSPDLTPGERGIATDAAKALGRSNGAVTLPFEANFFTEGQPQEPGYRGPCGDRPFPPYSPNIQAGYGEATHLGRFSGYGEFCGDGTDFLDDGMLTEGESLPYDNGFFTFTAANGDELWIEVAGAVLLSDRPGYDLEFFDPFQIVGGTGRFEGASGSGVTRSFVVAAEDHVEHVWAGTITLQPGL